MDYLMRYYVLASSQECAVACTSTLSIRLYLKQACDLIGWPLLLADSCANHIHTHIGENSDGCVYLIGLACIYYASVSYTFSWIFALGLFHLVRVWSATDGFVAQLDCR